MSTKKIVQFNLADIGEGITECELVQWYVTANQEVQQFDKLCEVQSDKATVEITSRYDGTIKKLHYEKGQMAKVGAPLVDIETDGEGETAAAQPDSKPAASKQPVQQPPPNVSQSTPTTQQASADVYTTPAVRRMAKEMGVNLSTVKGSGKNGRIMKEDLSQPTSAVVQQPAYQPQATSQVQLTPTMKAMIKSMKLSLQIPHFGFSDELSFLQMSKLRASANQTLEHEPYNQITKLSYMPLLLKSFSVALQKYPILNAKFVDGDVPSLTHRSSHNIGIAIDSPSGLVVPNIKNVEQKSVLEIATDLQKLTELAKKGQLAPDAFKDPTITISNIGNIAGRNLSPVIPAGTVCIVAIGRIQKLPRFDAKDQLYADQVVTASFSADHRVVDGASVARFFVEWKKLVENPATMVLHMK